MSVSVTFLGTGGSVPSKFRNLPSVLIRRGPELLLFDCGEGTQRQFLQAKAGTNRKMRIFITHLHGDHIFGLPGLLHTLSFMGRTRELHLIGPTGLIKLIRAVNNVVQLYSQFPLEIWEVGPGRVVNDEGYEVRAVSAEHGVRCLAYSFQEKPKPGRFDPVKARKLQIPEGPLWKKLQTSKYVRVGQRKIASSLVVGPPRRGVKITYAVDTRPCRSVVRLAAGSDLLIHDATFDDSHAVKAKEYGHSTAREAAQVAKASRSKLLALFHLSAMYENARPLLVQAKTVFRNTILAEDMKTVYISPE